jgi:hypothetical protein
MATRTITRLIDDIDGTEASETVEFGFRDRWYEIDLSQEHVEGLEEIMADYIPHARRLGKREARGTAGAVRRASSRSATRIDPSQIRAIREWARENGFAVQDRGRVPFKVMDAWEKQHQAA